MKKNNIKLSLLEYIILFFGVYLLIAVPLLMLGVFNVTASATLALVIILVFYLFFNQDLLSTQLHINIPLLIICIIGVLLRYPTYHYLTGGQDEGIYVSMSKFYRENGKTIFFDTTQDLIPEEFKVQFLKDNVHSTIFPTSAIYPGSYINDIEKNERYFQFYPAHPLLMSIAGEYFGDGNETSMLIVVSILSIILIYNLIFLLTKKYVIALLSAGVFSVHPLAVFFSRFPTSEVVVVFFTLSFIWFFFKWISTKKTNSLFFSLLMWFGLVLTHISSIFYLPIIFILLILLALKKLLTLKEIKLYLIAVLFIHLFSIYYGSHYSNRYFIDIYNAIFKPMKLFKLEINYFLNLFGITKFFLILYSIVITIYLILLDLILNIKNKITVENKKIIITKFTTVIKLILTIFLIIGLIQVYLFSFTNYFISNNWISARWMASNNGWLSVLRTTPMVLLFYNGPLFLISLFYVLGRRTKNFSFTWLFLSIVFLFFFIIRVIKPIFVPYHFYYARYLLPELSLVLIFIFMILFSEYYFKKKILLAFIATITLIYFGSISVLIHPHREMFQASTTIEKMANYINKNDLVFVISGAYTPHQTQLLFPLKFYYGFNVILTDANILPEYLKHFDDSHNIFIISNENIGSFGEEVVYKSNLVTEQLNSRKFIPFKTTIYKQKNDLLLLRFGNKITPLYLKNKTIIPQNFLREGFYNDNWSKGEIKIFNSNFIAESGTCISIEVIRLAPNVDSLQIVINESTFQLTKNNKIFTTVLPTDFKTQEVENILLKIPTFIPCDHSKKSTDCRELGIIIKEIIIQSSDLNTKCLTN